MNGYLEDFKKNISLYSDVNPPSRCDPNLPPHEDVSTQKFQHFWPNYFWQEDCLKIFLYRFLCKNSTPIVAPPYPLEIMIWTTLNLHYPRILLHNVQLSQIICFREDHFKIGALYSYLKVRHPHFGPTLPLGWWIWNYT